MWIYVKSRWALVLRRWSLRHVRLQLKQLLFRAISSLNSRKKIAEGGGADKVLESLAKKLKKNAAFQESRRWADAIVWLISVGDLFKRYSVSLEKQSASTNICPRFSILLTNQSINQSVIRQLSFVSSSDNQLAKESLQIKFNKTYVDLVVQWSYCKDCTREEHFQTEKARKMDIQKSVMVFCS